MTASNTSVPRFVQLFSTPFGLRHVAGVAVARWVVAGWLTILAAIFCVLGNGYWWGALLLAPAVLNGVLAYVMPRWSPILSAVQNDQRER